MKLLHNTKPESTRDSAVTFVCTVFELTSKSGYFLPEFNIEFVERGTGNSTYLTGGGTRLYASRLGPNLEPSSEVQAADSHVMADRVISALFISGGGLFWAKPKGRIFLHTPLEALRWESQVDLQPFYSERVRAVHDAFDKDEFASWFQFVSDNVAIRRALHDAVQAMKDPVESFVYIFRGFEWLRNGLDLSWDEIARDVGVTTKQIKQVGQIANDETGVRHASKSGVKQRATLETYATWIAGLVDAIESARARIDITYTKSDVKTRANKLRAAMQFDPYP